MNIQTFIFIHNQDLILKFEESNKFKGFENYTYVFLGDKETNKIEILNNVIIAKNLPFNIEQYPKFTSFTGWYALWKNGLISSDYINLFEYDTVYINDFDKTINDLIENKNPDFIGYVPYYITAADYVMNKKWIEYIIPSIKKHYNINIIEVLTEVLQKKQINLWSSTSNSTFKKEVFNEYMLWFEKLIDDLKDTETCGHAHERSISFFYFIKNKNVILTNGLLKHLQMDSHKTQDHIVNNDESIKILLKNTI